jgi:predicted 2-oxoglutarate/Fe(II)-dependent dioxygenase YbiX
LKQFEDDTIVDFPEIFMYEYIKMLLLLFIIILVVYLLPKYPTPRVLKSFLSDGECEHIMKEAKKNLETSTVTTSKKVDETVRKSDTAWLGREDPIVLEIMERCLKYTDRPIDNCEKLQVLRYKPGGFYKPHQDAFENEKNMRMYTFILALNDDYEGGETSFPNLNKEYKLNKGDALLFDTLDNYEFMTSKALHGGKPVKSGEKWICNLWVRKYPYN